MVHGLINATGYRFKDIAYISDCNKIPKNTMKNLNNLKILIVDCLRYTKHPSHFNLEDALNLIKVLKPKKTILTNLHADIDYYEIKKNLPNNVIPAYDGLNLRI